MNMNNLEQAVKFFVYSKYSLENRLTHILKSDWLSVKLSGITGIKWTREYSFEDFLKQYNFSISPFDFVRFCLPFSNPHYSYNKLFPMNIDPFLVVGGTYKKGYTIDSAEVLKTLDTLNNFDKEHQSATRYSKVGDIPLFVANQGKNRVSAYQMFKKQIRAYVTQTEYPQPKYLRLHYVPYFNLFVLSLQSGEQIEYEVLPFPEYTLTLLKAYGVQFGDKIPMDKGYFFFKHWRNKRIKICNYLMAS